MLLCPLHLQKRGKVREKKRVALLDLGPARLTQKRKKREKKTTPEVVATNGAMAYFLVMKVSFHFFMIFRR